MNIFLIYAIRQLGLLTLLGVILIVVLMKLKILLMSLVRPHLEYAAAARDPHIANQQLERVQRRAARFVKKDYRHTTSVTGLLDELGWLPALVRTS